jgi:hypothetical protein
MRALFVLIVSLILMGSMDLSEKKHVQRPQASYDGTYSLYVSLEDGMHFNWITGVETEGTYVLREEDGRVLKSGKTENGRVHGFSIEKRPKRAVQLEFGGEGSGTESVELYPDFDRSKSVFRKVDSLYVVGDVHGSYDHLMNLLQKSGVIDSELNWDGGTAHLVFVGDLFDRGDDVTKILWFIHRLETQAIKYGGRVHVLLGNHEIMTMTNDLRYIGRKEKALSIAYKVGYDYMFHPTQSYLGSWISHKPSVIKIDDVIFAHGGVVDLGTSVIQDFNEQAFYYLHEDIFLEISKAHADSASYDPEDWMRQKRFFFSDMSPYWYRGYATADTLEDQLDAMLKKYNSKLHVVGHTSLDTITQRYNGKLLTTDLSKKATELLFLKRERKNYRRFRIDSLGQMTEL